MLRPALVTVSLLALLGDTSQQQLGSFAAERPIGRQWQTAYQPWGQPPHSANYRNGGNSRSRSRSSSSGGSSSSGRWPNRVIYFAVDNSFERFRPVLRRAMSEIEERTCIRFQPRRNQRDYVYVVHGNGCHSKVGRAGGRQILSLGVGCTDIGSTLHELCHAIGLYHEHMRWDRDQYLQIFWQNIQPSMRDQFQKIPASQYRPASSFDYSSIMIYGSKAFSRNGRNTMVPRERRVRISESHFKEHLSASDVRNINALYGC